MGLCECDKERRKVRDFSIWIRDKDTQDTLDFLFLKLKEEEVLLKKFLLVEQYLIGRLTKSEFKKIRKQIRQEEGKDSDDIFLYMDIRIVLKQTTITEEDKKKLYKFLCSTFYTNPFREAIQDMVKSNKEKSQIQVSYTKKALSNMDLFQRFNNVL